MIIASFPNLKFEFSLSNVNLSLISTIYYLFSFVFTYFWIYFFGKFSNKYVYLIGGLLWIIPLICIRYSTSFESFLLLVAIIGIGSESIVVLINNYFLSMKLTKNFSRVYTLQIITQGAGGVFGAFLAAQTQGFFNLNWRDSFLFVGIISFLIFIIGIFILFNKNKNNEATNETKKYNFNFAKIKEIYYVRVNVLILISILISASFLTFLNIWTQMYFITVHNVSQEVAVITYIYLSGVEFLGFLFSGFILDYLKMKNHKLYFFLGFVGCTLSAAFFLLALIIPWDLEPIYGENIIELGIALLFTILANPKILFGYLFFTGAYFSYTCIDPYLTAMINHHNKGENKEIVININKGVVTFTYLIGPIIGGLIADIWGFNATFFSIPIALLVTCIPFILLGRS